MRCYKAKNKDTFSTPLVKHLLFCLIWSYTAIKMLYESNNKQMQVDLFIYKRIHQCPTRCALFVMRIN